jgi:hypothetical protein
LAEICDLVMRAKVAEAELRKGACRANGLATTRTPALPYTVHLVYFVGLVWPSTTGDEMPRCHERSAADDQAYWDSLLD